MLNQLNQLNRLNWIRRRRGGSKDPGELPAVFEVIFSDGRNFVEIRVSEATTVTPVDGTSIRIGSSGEFVTTPLTLAANTIQEIYHKDAGSFIIPRRKQITYLWLYTPSLSAIKCDITGMKLTYMALYSLGSSVITGDITGMRELTWLQLDGIGSSVITGDITGMELEFLLLNNLGSSVITGEITGKNLTRLYLDNIGSSLTYGASVLNITSDFGIQLLGNTVFPANGYIQLFADAATCVTDGKWDNYNKLLTISGGENPGWSNVEEYYTILRNGGVTVTVPSAWEWESDDDDDPSSEEGELPATFTIAAGFVDTGIKYINFSEPITVTMTGGVTVSLSGTPYESGATIPVATDGFHMLTINNPGEDAGSITFGKRKQITTLGLSDLGSSAITGDITGMGLMMLALENLGSSAITGDITGMNLMALSLVNLGSSVAITGDITGMGMMMLYLVNLGSSSVAITGDITGMELAELVLEDIGSCVITGT